MPDRYRVTVDKGACDGIFACLVRDDRLDEAEGAAAACPPSAISVEVLE